MTVEYPLEVAQQLARERDELRTERDKFKQAFLEGSDKVVELRAEVARQTEELNDLDTKLGSALRAIGLEHAESERQKAFIDSIMPELTMMRTEHARANAEGERLRAEVETWGQIWNDEALLAARVESLRDGSAQR